MEAADTLRSGTCAVRPGIELERFVQVRKDTWGTCTRCKKRARKGIYVLHRGQYAVQLAWWLAFFRPERFLIVTAAELKDPNAQVEVCGPSMILDWLVRNNSAFARKLAT
jgi:hypothetical protein